MDSRAIRQAWRELLPATISVSVGPLLEDAPPLTAIERASAGMMDAERMREFKNGRLYAKRALAMLGVYGVELPIAPDRAPLWPAGLVGSLTHVSQPACGHVAAAVARAHTVRAIGIDAEREGSLHPHAWEHVLTERELERIRTLPPHMRAAEAQIIWCAKEAVAKAARRPTEPTEVEIECDPAGGGFMAIWKVTGGGNSASSTEIWRGRTARSQGFILAAVVLPQSRSHPAYQRYRLTNSDHHLGDTTPWTRAASDSPTACLHSGYPPTGTEHQ